MFPPSLSRSLPPIVFKLLYFSFSGLGLPINANTNYMEWPNQTTSYPYEHPFMHTVRPHSNSFLVFYSLDAYTGEVDLEDFRLPERRSVKGENTLPMLMSALLSRKLGFVFLFHTMV